LNCFSNVQNTDKNQNYSLKSEFKNELGLHKPPSAATLVIGWSIVYGGYFEYFKNIESLCQQTDFLR
jgi:hypothetical protein